MSPQIWTQMMAFICDLLFILHFNYCAWVGGSSAGRCLGLPGRNHAILCWFFTPWCLTWHCQASDLQEVLAWRRACPCWLLCHSSYPFQPETPHTPPSQLFFKISKISHISSYRISEFLCLRFNQNIRKLFHAIILAWILREMDFLPSAEAFL